MRDAAFDPFWQKDKETVTVKVANEEIKAYYDKLSDPMKKSFVNYFFNKCCTKDPKFYTVAKMNTINMLIGGTLFDNLISVCINEQNAKK